MKPEGEGIREILESGQFSTVFSFRNPQAWSSWRNGKATKREAEKQRFKSSHHTFSIGTRQGKDEKSNHAGKQS